MKPRLVLLFAILLTLSTAGPALAHGAQVEYALSTTVELVATYDSGEPLAGGQVTVYAPDDPATPWLTGTCDDAGRFTFTPDSEKPGTWDVQVRQAGHGDIVHIPVGTGGGSSSGSGGGFSPAQIALMAVCVVWGLVGTALYFFGRNRAAPKEPAA